MSFLFFLTLPIPIKPKFPDFKSGFRPGPPLTAPSLKSEIIV